MKRLLIVCFVVLLAACNGAPSSSAISPSPTADSSAVTVSSFKATVSGAVNGEFGGSGSYFKQNNGGLLVSLVGTRGPSGATITIILPTGIVAGTYTPKSYAHAYDTAANKITGIGASFSIQNKTGGVDTYGDISEGSLNLDSVDPMTGSIHFKAKLENGGEVEVSATFYQLIAA